MAIDTSMYSMLKPADVTGAVEKGLSLRELADQRVARQKAAQEQEQIKAAYQAGVVTSPDGSASVDPQRTLSALARVSPQEAQRFQMQQTQNQKINMEQKLQELDLISRSLGGVKDAQGWEVAKAQLERSGVDMSRFQNTPYDEKMVGQLHGMTLTAKDRMEQQFKERELAIKELEARTKKAESGAAAVKMTEAQSKALGFGRRAMLADQMINQVTNDPNADVSSITTQIKTSLPKWMGGVRDPKEQTLAVAKTSFIASVLRKESGAAVTPEEFEQYSRIYFPAPGDDKQTLENKRVLRQNFIDTEKMTAGGAWKDPLPLQDVNAQSQTKVVDGVTYKKVPGGWQEVTTVGKK